MAVSYDQLREGEVLHPPADLPEPTLSVNARKVLERRYLHRIDSRVVETPGGGFWRVAEETVDAALVDLSQRESKQLMDLL